MTKKYVYYFGGNKAEGRANMKNLLGGKGANLAEMVNFGLPVPAGFTITTEVCTYYYKNSKNYPKSLYKEVKQALSRIEKQMGAEFGNPQNPLLLSVRSGARSSMPGMMETVLNVGLNDNTLEGLIKKTGNSRFAYDSLRRLIQMYSDVVMEKAAGIEPKKDMGIRTLLEKELKKMKNERGIDKDSDLTTDDLKELVGIYKKKVYEVLGKKFPENPEDQLWGAIGAVFQSWMGKRAIEYRRIENIPDDWGTAVNVQSMVFGNLNDISATGVAFTRNPATGENHFYGEWLPNAQGEDVVAGLRTPNPINETCKGEHNANLPTLESVMPEVYKELDGYQNRLEKHYRDMLDIEFTIENGKLYMLQCRIGKRSGMAAIKIALDMLKEKIISKKEVILRVSSHHVDEAVHPILDPEAEKTAEKITKGLPAGPGGATGQVVFTAQDASEWVKQEYTDEKGKKRKRQVILVREETNPEDVAGMRASDAILTVRGGMTSHAAIVARGWGKSCVVGAGEINIDEQNKVFKVGDITVKEGDWISINGAKGKIYKDKLPMIDVDPDNKDLKTFLKMCDKYKKLKVRTNADTPQDAKKALEFGAVGIGLFRTEHMFYGEGSEEPLFVLRKMILAKETEERKPVVDELFKYVKEDIKGTLEVMDGHPVTIRTLDPPLHEFIPDKPEEIQQLSERLNLPIKEIQDRADSLRETNPMLGHRGVRLGITYPEITEMQIRAILESTAELLKEGKKIYPEIMIPVVGVDKELKHQKQIVEKIHDEVAQKYGLKKIKYLFGTMIEIPRAALTADKIAEYAEFFSFGTNDMTQMTFGFSRDDISGFLPSYIKRGILPDDPFNVIDIEGVGALMKLTIDKVRGKKIKLGICGEHGGEPKSVAFCHKLKLDYVSCSPFRVPVARHAAALAALKEKKKQ